MGRPGRGSRVHRAGTPVCSLIVGQGTPKVNISITLVLVQLKDDGRLEAM